MCLQAGQEPVPVLWPIQVFSSCANAGTSSSGVKVHLNMCKCKVLMSFKSCVVLYLVVLGCVVLSCV